MQLMPRSDGSGTNYIVKQELQIPIGTLGISYPEGNVHAPNEKIRLKDYLNSVRHLARILDAFGKY